MPDEIALAAIELVAPLQSHAAIKIVSDSAIQLIDIDSFQTLPKALALRMKVRHRFIMVVPLNLEAVLQRFDDNIVNILVET
ncbi:MULTISPECIES: hypothetical protein [Sphingomonadales]|uniref:hypothetical protein n=1 Tax=Sphingomonadales TaxID=204457 RepID=UPI000567B93D|nr:MULTISPECIES: hypothetical protein [Sphingomonadaceae]WQE08250.1 hypothetical protein U0025_05010 [Sphingobium yanoikuyae]